MTRRERRAQARALRRAGLIAPARLDWLANRLAYTLLRHDSFTGIGSGLKAQARIAEAALSGERERREAAEANATASLTLAGKTIEARSYAERRSRPLSGSATGRSPRSTPTTEGPMPDPNLTLAQLFSADPENRRALHHVIEAVQLDSGLSYPAALDRTCEAAEAAHNAGDATVGGLLQRALGDVEGMTESLRLLEAPTRRSTIQGSRRRRGGEDDTGAAACRADDRSAVIRGRGDQRADVDLGQNSPPT